MEKTQTKMSHKMERKAVGVIIDNILKGMKKDREKDTGKYDKDKKTFYEGIHVFLIIVFSIGYDNPGKG